LQKQQLWQRFFKQVDCTRVNEPSITKTDAIAQVLSEVPPDFGWTPKHKYAVECYTHHCKQADPESSGSKQGSSGSKQVSRPDWSKFVMDGAKHLIKAVKTRGLRARAFHGTPRHPLGDWHQEPGGAVHMKPGSFVRADKLLEDLVDESVEKPVQGPFSWCVTSQDSGDLSDNQLSEAINAVLRHMRTHHASRMVLRRGSPFCKLLDGLEDGQEFLRGLPPYWKHLVVMSVVCMERNVIEAGGPHRPPAELSVPLGLAHVVLTDDVPVFTAQGEYADEGVDVQVLVMCKSKVLVLNGKDLRSPQFMQLQVAS
jgi:hypothetical protein